MYGSTLNTEASISPIAMPRAYLSELKSGGKPPATLFLGFKTPSGKTWQAEPMFSELSTLRQQAVMLELDGEVEFHQLARKIFRHRQSGPPAAY